MPFQTGFKHLSRRGRVVLIAAAVVVLVTGASLYKGYEYIQHDPRFCHSCHIMNEPFQKWETSPHHMVTCHKCHQQEIKDSLWQVWFYLTRRPEKVIHHPTLNHEVCAQCHLSEDHQWKLVGETAGHKTHFEKAGIDCLDCHIGGVHEFLRPVDACLKCHTDKAEGPGKKMAFIHCTECHVFLSKQTELLPIRATCLGCHGKIEVGRESFPSDAPMSSFDCYICHKPHEKIRPDREICLSCHPDAMTGHHGMNEGASCADCHKPHQWKTQ